MATTVFRERWQYRAVETIVFSISNCKAPKVKPKVRYSTTVHRKIFHLKRIKKSLIKALRKARKAPEKSAAEFGCPYNIVIVALS